MANKMHPGMFRCYEAALPDEPMFVILGRDPAGPATLEFWANERHRQGKTTDPDDNSRIGGSLREADEMRDWRKRMIDHAEEMGQPPVWKLPRPEEHGDDKPIREIAMSPALGMPYGVGNAFENRLHTQRELMVSVGKEVREIAHSLTEIYRNARVPGEMADLVTKLHTEVERLAEAARSVKLSDTDPYAEFAKNLGKPVEHVWYDYADEENEHPRKVIPLSFTRMHELLDYATCYGEFDENTPNGTLSKYGESMSSPMNDARRHAIWVYKKCMGVIPEGAEPPVADVPAPTVPVYIEGLFGVPGVDQPQTMDQIAAMYRKAAQSVTVNGVKMPTLDSAPEDLAHAPEVPHHRFSVFHEAGDYAYARGLEVNPMHLATALDAMAKSGWHLCAIFGQTDAQHIGFIFRRDRPEFSVFERAHGFGEPLPTMTRPRGSTFAKPEVADAYASGKPLDEIAAIAHPEDIKSRTFMVTGRDAEKTHWTHASWSSDMGERAQLEQVMQSLRPDKRNAFLLKESATSIAHYWETASVASVLRFIHLIDWQDRVALLDPISPAALAKVLGCGGEGQEPCPEFGRGLEP
jgi:hypothetical protein